MIAIRTVGIFSVSDTYWQSFTSRKENGVFCGGKKERKNNMGEIGKIANIEYRHSMLFGLWSFKFHF